MTVQPESHAAEAFADEPPRNGIVRALKLGAAGILAVFLAGGTAGAFAALNEDQSYDAKGIALVAVFAFATIGSLAWLVVLLRNAPTARRETPRVARARRMLVASGAIGGVLGLLFGAGGFEDPWFPVSDAPMPALLAVVTLVIVGLAIPAITLAWHRAVDEHEEQVYRFASLIALYTYFWVSLMWWIATRGGFAPPVDGKAIFAIVWIVWGLSWAWGKYR